LVVAFLCIAGREMKRNTKCFKYNSSKMQRATFCGSANQIAWVFVSQKDKEGMNQELLISCIEVRRELSNYIDDEITPELRSRLEEHVATCSGCKAIYDGMRNILTLVTATELIELPRGFSARLYRMLRQADSN
jgi:hypothetical protein